MNQSTDIAELSKRFNELRSFLYDLVNSDPEQAITACEELQTDELLSMRNLKALKATVLIDAGTETKNSSAIDKGIELVKELLSVEGPRADLHYCLANGLTGSADLVEFTGPNWYLDTAERRRKARHLFRFVNTYEGGHEVSSRSLANLANALIKSYRFLEAYDFYMAAIEKDSRNGVALTGAARILLHFANQNIGNRDALLAVAAEHIRTAKQHSYRIRELAGETAFKQLSSLLKTDIRSAKPVDLSGATQYQTFIAKHRLALSPTIEGLDLVLSRWDSLLINSVSESLDSEHGVPTIFAMFNILKSEYLAARHIAFLSLEGDAPESGLYADTLDYACYGTKFSLLTIAQKTCLDILDKIAVAASEYLELPGKPNSITFLTRWFDEGQKGHKLLKWQHEVRSEIERGNTALIALAESAYDIRQEGFLEEKRLVRNTSTHRFSVLHDFGVTPSRESSYVDHFNLADFERQVIESLQVSRSALFYLVEMIQQCEYKKESDGSLMAPINVPDHDWVRGSET